MSKAFGIAFGCAIAIIAVVLWFGFDKTRVNHLEAEGHIGKVRVQAIDDKMAFVVIDFNVKNPSDRDFLTRMITVELDRPGGAVTGGPVAAADIESAFQTYPALGQRFNMALKERDTIAAHSEADRMVAARFDLPVSALENRKVTLHLLDVTGVEVVMEKSTEK